MRPPAPLLALAFALAASPALSEGDAGKGLSLGIAVAGMTRSGDDCHLSFQVRNRLTADVLRFTAGFAVLDGSGAAIGEGVFATGRVRRLQPYQRVASFKAPEGEEGCGDAAAVVLDVRECVLHGTGDVGPVYCREAFVAEGEGLPVAMAGAVPAGEARETEIAALGLRVSPLTSELAQAYGISGAGRGLVVTAAGGPAGGMGLREGDLLIEVDQDPVDSVETLEERIRAARGRGQGSVLCMVFRDGGRRWLVARFQDG